MRQYQQRGLAQPEVFWSSHDLPTHLARTAYAIFPLSKKMKCELVAALELYMKISLCSQWAGLLSGWRADRGQGRIGWSYWGRTRTSTWPPSACWRPPPGPTPGSPSQLSSPLMSLPAGCAGCEVSTDRKCWVGRCCALLPAGSECRANLCRTRTPATPSSSPGPPSSPPETFLWPMSRLI